MTARPLGDLVAGIASNLDPDRQRDHVWRHSYDIDSPEGKPWLYVLDRSREAWRVVKNALKLTCAEDVVEQSRQARLARLKGERPVEKRLRMGDEHVLAAYLDDYNVETGELFTAQATIAQELGLCLSRVNESLQRLRRHGYLDWVRRSRATEAEGQSGWQRKQASNGYFFDWKRRMPPRTWSRFWQLVVAGLKKIGKEAIAKTKALFTRVVVQRLLGRPRSSPPPGPRLQTRLKRDSSPRIYPGRER